MAVLRCSLLFERFPPKHNLVLFGQPNCFYALFHETERGSESRITPLQTLQPLNDEDIEKYIRPSWKWSGANTF